MGGRPPGPDPNDQAEKAHVALSASTAQVDERREVTKHDEDEGEHGQKLLHELDALFVDSFGKDEDDDLPPEEEHDEDCDCGFCGPCGAWAFARGQHPAQLRGDFRSTSAA